MNKIGNSHKITSHDYEEIKRQLASGEAYYKIADSLNISGSSMSSAVKRLKWKEYCESTK